MTKAGKKYQQFDAFLSHNGRDKPQVEQIARWLEEEAGLHVWLDKWNILPGDPWQEKIEEALDDSKACVVFLGPEGLGSWQNEEMRAALSDRVSSKQIRVVPVLLPNTHRPQEESELPKFLRRLSWVKFRDHVNEEDNLQMLAWGIKGERDRKIDKRNTYIDICPFRGLEVFREQDAPFFFGRENIVQLLADYLEINRFLAVVGPSGSGKSSVVQAGLIPELKERVKKAIQKKDSEEIILTTVFTPETRPLEKIAVSIRQVQSQVGSPESLADIINQLKNDKESLHYKALELCPDPKSQKLILVIDQFEELFTQTQDDEERLQFIQLLLSAVEVQNGPVKIVITMRSDFLGKCASYPDLNVYVFDHLFQVGPMEPEDLRRAIEEPALMAGLAFDEGLVSRILQDTSGSPGELPLVEHALTELYELRNGNQLTQQAYDEIGGVKGALAKRAEQEFKKLTPEQQEILRKMFVLRLIQPGEGTEDTRRRATKHELLSVGSSHSLAEQVLRELTDARLLTTARDENRQQELVDVAHEALIRQWSRVQDWLKEERENARLLGNLRHAVQEWEREKRNPDYLYSGTQLVRVEELLNRYTDDLTINEKEFISASINRRDITQRRRKQIFTGVGVFVAVALVFVSIMALKLNDVNNEVRKQLALNYWVNGRNALNEGNDLLFLHYSSHALSESPDDMLSIAIAQDINQVRDFFGLKNIFTHNEYVFGASFSNDESKILTWSFDGTARLWNADTGEQLVVLTHEGRVFHAIFSSDDSKILTSGENGTAVLWDAVTGERLIELTHDDTVAGSIFSSDESKILTWSNDGTAAVWDAENGERFVELLHNDRVNWAGFSSDESKILTWSDDGIASLWDAVNGQKIGSDVTHDERIRGLDFSPDKSKILTWSEDGIASLWDGVNGERLAELIHTHDLDLDGAVFSTDGSTILTWSDFNGTAKLWDVATRKQIGSDFIHNRNEPLGNSDDRILMAAFAPDGSTFLTLGYNEQVVLWEVATGVRLAELTHDTERIYNVSFSSDGSKILTLGVDQTARLWDGATGEWLAEITHGVDMYVGASFSSEGSKILTWGDDGTARLWVAAQQILPEAEFKHGESMVGATFSTDDSRIVTWSDDETARLWDAATGQQIGSDLTHDVRVNWEATNEDKLGGEFIKIRTKQVFSPDSSKILTVNDESTVNGLLVLDAFTRERLFELPLITSIGGVFSFDGSKIFTWNINGTARLWNAETGEQIGSDLLHRPLSGTPVFSSDGSKILTWSENKTIGLWEVATGYQLAYLSHDGWISEASFSSDDSRIMTVSEDGTLKLWDATTRTQLAELNHDGKVRGANFSSDDSKILTWGDGTAKLWNVPGDLDFPFDQYILQTQTLTSTKLDLISGKIIPLPSEEWLKIHQEWLDVAREHANVCKYKSQNVYLQMWAENNE